MRDHNICDGTNFEPIYPRPAVEGKSYVLLTIPLDCSASNQSDKIIHSVRLRHLLETKTMIQSVYPQSEGDGGDDVGGGDCGQNNSRLPTKSRMCLRMTTVETR